MLLLLLLLLRAQFLLFFSILLSAAVGVAVAVVVFVLFRFQQLIDTSAFAMVHDIKVLNLTAKTASLSISLPPPAFRSSTSLNGT